MHIFGLSAEPQPKDYRAKRFFSGGLKLSGALQSLSVTELEHC